MKMVKMPDPLRSTEHVHLEEQNVHGHSSQSSLVASKTEELGHGSPSHVDADVPSSQQAHEPTSKDAAGSKYNRLRTPVGPRLQEKDKPVSNTRVAREHPIGPRKRN